MAEAKQPRKPRTRAAAAEGTPAETAAPADGATAAAPAEPVKRKRGRPRKVRPEEAPAADTAALALWHARSPVRLR